MKNRIYSALKGSNGYMTVFSLAAQGSICFLFGIKYIEAGYGTIQLPIWVLFVLTILSYFSAWHIAKKWHSFVYMFKYDSLPLTPVAFSIITYVILAGLYHGDQFILALLCVFYSVLNSFLSLSLKNNGKNAKIEPVSRRYTIMVPLVFITMQHIVFGCAVVLSIQGEWYSLLIYAIVCIIYMIIWKYTLKKESTDVLPINVLVIAAIGLGAIASYYLARNGRLFNLPTKSVVTTAKCLIISVYCGSIISIPFLLEVTQIHRSVRNDAKNYDDRMRVLSGMNIVGTLFVYSSWLFLSQLSIIYLCGYAAVFTLYIIVARHRYEKRISSPYMGNIISILFSSTGIALIWLSEFSGVWDSFKKVPEVSFALVATCDFAAILGTLFTFLKKEGGIKEIGLKIKKLRLLGFHLVSLGVIVLFMSFINNNRAKFAMLVAGVEMILELISYLLIKYGNTLFKSDETEQ